MLSLLLLLTLLGQADLDAVRVADTRAAVAELMAGRPEPIVGRFDDRMAAALPESQLRQTLAQLQVQAGTFQAITAARAEMRGNLRVVTVTCAFSNGPLDVVVAWTPEGRVAGLNIRPAVAMREYQPPAYVDVSRFSESAVTVDAGSGWPLPGTLTMPAGDGPVPAVVLVHGSGAQDRDATLPPNRMFRDLAWGLASSGIAVLRYDKRTFAHPAAAAQREHFTVKDETMDDALAAVALLRRTPRVRADRVFVLGHSLGGMLAPRIGAAEPSIAGLIVLAGAVRPLEDTVLSQVRYLAEADGVVSDGERTLIADAEAFVRKARALKPGDPPLTGPLGSGPASYVIDMRGYDPVKVAQTLSMPMLILQGSRDYQVTMADFAAWSAVADARTGISRKAYPALNHMFMAGAGKSLPAEYFVEGHVDAAVVADIAAWIQRS